MKGRPQNLKIVTERSAGATRVSRHMKMEVLVDDSEQKINQNASLNIQNYTNIYVQT